MEKKQKKRQPRYRPHYATLPAYKKTIDLDAQFTVSTAKVPRELRYGRLADLRNMILDIMVNIAYADMDETERITYIEKAEGLLDRLKVEVRILYDLKMIKMPGLDAIIAEEGNLAAQLTGWKNSTIEKLNI